MELRVSVKGQKDLTGFFFQLIWRMFSLWIWLEGFFIHSSKVFQHLMRMPEQVRTETCCTNILSVFLLCAKLCKARNVWWFSEFRILFPFLKSHLAKAFHNNENNQHPQTTHKPKPKERSSNSIRTTRQSAIIRRHAFFLVDNNTGAWAQQCDTRYSKTPSAGMGWRIFCSWDFKKTVPNITTKFTRLFSLPIDWAYLWPSKNG